MPQSSKDGDSSLKRRSLFGRPSLTAFTTNPSHNRTVSGSSRESTNVLKKRRTLSSLGSLRPNLEDDTDEHSLISPADPSVRPQLSVKTSGTRPTSLIGSWRLSRSAISATDEPKSGTSTRAPSINSDDQGDTPAKSRHILLHGESITRSTVLSKKVEYLVLTETHLVRFKSAQKAAETFPGVSPTGRGSVGRHSSSLSAGSSHDLLYAASESSGDRYEGLPLQQFVAVYQLEDGRPYFALEIAYLDDHTNHASTMILQFSTPEDMLSWLKAIRKAANEIRIRNPNPISQSNSLLASRVVEREQDYEPRNYSLYKVVQRPILKTGTRSSTDDLAKIATTLCFLAIGVHKVHIIPLSKSGHRHSTPVLGSYNEQSSYGIMSLTSLKISEHDDGIELTFRLPLHKQKTLKLATLASHDIAVRLRSVEVRLRPEWESRPYLFMVPDEVKDEILRDASPRIADSLDSLDRTLIAYCMAYNVNPANIRYYINYTAEDSPCFELLAPADARKPTYSVNELLAIMRALRYNESFGSMSFAGVSLDSLNGLCDTNGDEHLCTKTKRGTPIQMDATTLSRSCLLVQELRALAVTNKKMRRMDFTSCIARKPNDYAESPKGRDIGCGIVEALFPLCIHNTTNVDWINLNNIRLGETDLDYVVQAVVERQCHFRAIGLSNCGLNDRSIGLILESLRAQENTLEAIDLSRNFARISPTTFDLQIGAFAYIRKLNLSQMSRTLDPEPLISAETLQMWRLQELILTGTALNPASVDAIAAYLCNYKQSKGLRELRLDHTYLTGKEISVLLHSLTETPGVGRDMHLDISENDVEQGLATFTKALAANYAPQYLSIREIEFEDEGAFRKLVLAMATNTTVTHLDISKISLPCDASDETCQAMESLFARNKTIEFLDISGEESRLELAKFGVGINRALNGLKHNTTLRILRIQYQKLGLQGACSLADVLKVNTGLRELWCENNDIPLSGFTDIVNSLHRNTSLTYIPPMAESKQLALKKTEEEIKQVRDTRAYDAMPKSSSMRSKFAHKVGRYQKEKPSVGAPLLSDQDIMAALSLVDESWSRQIYRLQAYLQRNRDIAEGVPTAMEIEEEEFERPSTAVLEDLTKLVEKVKIESTPTAEKELDLSETFDPAAVLAEINSEKDSEDRLEMKSPSRSHRSSAASPTGA